VFLWSLEAWSLELPAVSNSRVTKNWQGFANRRLAVWVKLCHCEPVTRQADTAFVRRAKSLRERPFIVQCADFRCMAYRDSSGKWLDYFSGDEIKGEVTILSEA